MVLPLLWILLFVITGCDSQKGGGGSEEEITTFSMFAIDINPNDDDFSSPVAQAITDATGVKLDIDYPQGDIARKIGIMIASGDYPDLIFVKSEEMSQLVAAGAYRDLRPLIEEYGPHLQKLYGDNMKRLRFSSDDPAIYALSSSEVDGAKWQPGMGFELQHRVVMSLGYPEIKTLEDYEKAIRSYLDMHPMTDGEPTIGITLCTDDWRWLITLGNPAGFATGAPDDGNWYINPDTYEASYRFLRPQEKEYFRWLNKIYHEGLLDPDSFVQRYDAYLAKIASGRVLGLIDALWEFSPGDNILRDENKLDKTYGIYPVQMDESTQAQDFRDTDYLAGYGIGISVSCEDPVGAIQFLDWMTTEEAQILRYWGIEGTHYLTGKDGRYITDAMWDRRVNDADFAKETGVGVYLYPYPRWGLGKLDSTGQSISATTIDNIISNYHPLEKEVLSAYGVETWGELYPQSDELRKSEWGVAFMVNIPMETGINATLSQCDDIMKKGLIDAVAGPSEDFDRNWQNIMDRLDEAGVHEMGKKFTKLVKDRVESFK